MLLVVICYNNFLMCPKNIFSLRLNGLNSTQIAHKNIIFLVCLIFYWMYQYSLNQPNNQEKATRGTNSLHLFLNIERNKKCVFFIILWSNFLKVKLHHKAKIVFYRKFNTAGDTLNSLFFDFSLVFIL